MEVPVAHQHVQHSAGGGDRNHGMAFLTGEW
jgi:hypothetical protein